MKTQQKNNSISRKEIIDFICRLNYCATREQKNPGCDYSAGHEDGWKSACAYFSHELYKVIRRNDKN